MYFIMVKKTSLETFTYSKSIIETLGNQKNRNTSKMCEICSNLAVKYQVDVVLLSLLLTLNIFHTFF